MADPKLAHLDSNLISPAFIAEMDGILAMVRRLLRYHPTTLASHLHGQKSLEFVEYTPYSAGDDLRRVDWNVYRRLRHVVVKKYAVELPSHWAVGIDVSASMTMYGKLSFARRLAAVLIYLGVTLVDSVTLFLFPGLPQVWCYRRRGDVKQGLSLLSTCGGQAATASFRQIAAQLARRTKVLLLSDFYGTVAQEWLTMATLKEMHGTALHIVAHEEKDPHWQGIFVLQDAETGEASRLAVTPALLTEYRLRFAEHMDTTKAICRKRHVSHHEVAADLPLDRAVLQILQNIGIIK
jgi:uncharacterized protein (DUF58 family)